MYGAIWASDVEFDSAWVLAKGGQTDVLEDSPSKAADGVPLGSSTDWDEETGLAWVTVGTM